MINFIKNRLALFLVVIVFVICKIPYLFYAYYWDESWPYVPAIRAMYRHGASLMPGSVEPNLTRGHPLFFHAIGAIWMNVFGASHVSMHSFALLISVAMLVVVYEAGLSLFNKRVAIMSLLLVATQVIFFVQSSFLLPEVLVALLVFLSIYFFVKDKYLLAALCLTALFYTKESGLITGVVFGVAAVIGLFNKKERMQVRLLSLSSVAVPCLLICVFFLIQKHVNGWYIFPLHNDLIEYKWKSFWYTFRMSVVCSAFLRDYRYWYFILVLLLSVFATIKNKNTWHLVIFLPAIAIYYFVDDMRAGRLLPSVPFFIVFIFSVILFLYSLSRLKIYSNVLQEKFSVISCAFILCFFCFSAMNFFTPRYLLAAIVPLLFFTAVIFEALMSRTYRQVFYPLLGAFIVIAFFSFYTNDGSGDADPGAFDGIDVHQHVIAYMEKNGYYSRAVSTCSFLETQHLVNPDCGFLSRDKVFTNVRWGIDKNTEFVIFDNMESDYRYNDVKKDNSFHLIDKYQKGRAWSEIYGR